MKDLMSDLVPETKGGELSIDQDTRAYLSTFLPRQRRSLTSPLCGGYKPSFVVLIRWGALLIK